MKDVYMSEMVGGGYDEFWRFKGRYRVVKGSRASKKSKTAALWYVCNLTKAKYREANLLVIRKTYRTLKDSCFCELKWAIKRLGLEETWIAKESPLEITNKKTGQKIFFRGLDDSLKITSITVTTGVLCWLWIEEAYEIGSERDFDTIDESIRGAVPEGLFKQVTLTFNPWNEHHWLKKRFFDKADKDTLAITTNYTCNEWLDESDKKLFERMRINNPRRYKTAALGEWGISDGLVYDNWSEKEFVIVGKIDAVGKENAVVGDDLKSVFGIDFGYTHDPTAVVFAYFDEKTRTIYVEDEIYEKRLSNRRIYELISEKGFGRAKFIADSAEPKSIDELKGLGLRVSAAKKGRDSVNSGIQWLQDCRIVVHPRCENFVCEISNYSWGQNAVGRNVNVPVDEFNHLMDALRYGVQAACGWRRWIV